MDDGDGHFAIGHCVFEMIQFDNGKAEGITGEKSRRLVSACAASFTARIEVVVWWI